MTAVETKCTLFFTSYLIQILLALVQKWMSLNYRYNIEENLTKRM